MKNLHILFNIFTILALISCKHEVSETQTDEKLIKISTEQFHEENMKLGKVDKVEIKEIVVFSGKIVPKLNGMAKISVPVPGKIISVQVQSGQYVRTNEALFKIGGNELIDLQQNFASSSAKLKQLKTNYYKAKELYDENITTETEYLLAESTYKVELATYSALKAKLKNIGLNLTNIENGKYASQYSVTAPISGQIGEINIVRGQHVNSEAEIVEVIDNNKTELQLTLFETDFTKVQIGQNVQFWGIDRNTSKSTATINRIGGKLSNSNTIDCFASILGKTNTYAINQMMSGEIILSTDSVPAIPRSAVLAIGTNHYVLIKKSEDDSGYSFEKKKIFTGRLSEDYIEVLDGVDEEEEILISGTYNINLE